MNPNSAEINRLTKESIAIAAKELLMDNKRLTVTNICNKAGVSRNAFYRNFETIDETVVFYIMLKWAEYSKKNNVESTPEDQKGKHLLRFFYEERDFVRALKKGNMLHLVEKTFITTIVPKDVDGGMRYFLYSAAYLMYGFTRAMIDNDFCDGPDLIESMANSMNQSEN